MTHELGHLFRLGHGVLLKYNTDGTYNSADGYGDRTTNEGSVAAGGWNLPNYHRLNWIEEDEVAVFHKEDSGTVYRIRNIKKVIILSTWQVLFTICRSLVTACGFQSPTVILMETITWVISLH